MMGRWFRFVVPAAAAGFAAQAIAVAAESAPASASAYDALIAPLFRARCVECHGEQKQKAKLALHSWEAVQRGSDAGPIFVPGKPAQSVVLERLRLPITDDDHMPPSDHPQPSAEEIALLARWIEQGASPTAKVADLRLSPELARAAEQLPARLAAAARAPAQAEPLWKFDAAAVEESRAPLAAKVKALQRRFPGALNYESRTSAALHFTAAGLGRAFGDAELAALADVREEVAVIDLSGTGITDASAKVLEGFRNVRVFRAGFTEIGDPSVQVLATLPKLELLALPGTKVTAASVTALSKARALRSLRVADTAAERPAQDANLPVVPSAADILPPVEDSKADPAARATRP